MATDIQIQPKAPQPRQTLVPKQGLQSNQHAIPFSGKQSISQEATLATNEKPVEEVGQVQRQVLQEKVAQLNDHMQNLSRNLQFTVDEESGDSVVTVRDSETEEIIRQFPSEEVLNAKNAANKFKGILLEAKV